MSTTLKKIFHISDLHCRNFNRHKEYKKVFRSLYASIREQMKEYSLDDTNSMIILTGDIAHSKNEMTPELVDIISGLFRSCADILPTAVITGNHDTNLNNENRLDALTPIIEAMKHPNLYYWKDSGVYELYEGWNTKFSVYSVFGSTDNWVRANQIEGDCYKIALHHGAVYGALTDLGYEVKNEFVNTTIFDGFDLALLGDIHKRQILQPYRIEDNKVYPAVGYPGSLIQQNHGEDIDRGYFLWDLDEHDYEYISIPNEFGYATIDIKGGEIVTDQRFIDSLPEKVRLRVRYNDTQYSEVQSIIQNLKQRFSIEEISTQKLDETTNTNTYKRVGIGDVRDVEYQNKLITDYIEKTIPNKIVDLDGIRHINRVTNSKLSTDTSIVRHVIWKPKKFTFSNMFSFGPNNSIDFSDFNGVQGLFAPNAYGKSTMLDAFTFCLFDKCSRTYKAQDVLNIKKNDFECKLEFELNDETFIIERKGVQDSKEKAKVTVNFTRIDALGKKHILNGKDRDDTNKIIRDFIGTYDDFLLTALSTQNDSKNFIFKTQKERKELLNSFLDISIFEDLFAVAKKDIKETESAMKLLQVEVNQNNVTELKERAREEFKEYKVLSANCSVMEGECTTLSNEVADINKQIQDLGTLVDINLVNNRKTQNLESLKLNKANLSQAEQAVVIHTNSLNEIVLPTMSKSIIDQQIIELNDMVKKYTNKRAELMDENTSNIAFLNMINDNIERLHTHEYDPNCEYCVKNPFVIDARSGIERKPELEKSIETNKELILKIGTNLVTVNEKLNELKNDLQIISNHKSTSEKLQIQIDSVQSKKQMIQKLEETIKDLEEQEKLYESQKLQIEKNHELRERLKLVETDLKSKKEILKRTQQDAMRLNSSIEVLKSKVILYSEKQDQLKKLSDEFDFYEIYLDSISRDGVPHQLLTMILPVIENEVNLILNQIVPFTSTISSDDKQNINCYINYSPEQSWSVELASGMERFIMSIAVRSALIGITSLPRPNFIAIDEGFGVLDSDKLNSVHLLFEYIKSQFDFILCISHLDAMKDIVDNVISIDKSDQGFSEIKI